MYTEKFIRKFEDRFIPEPNTGCWLWTSALNDAGYGDYRTIRTRRAHRLSWEIYNGPIPKGMHILHRCDLPCCVNPRHLFLGNHQDNMDDMNAKGRQRHPKEQYHHTKVTPKQVLEIRVLRQAGLSFRAIGKEYGVSRHCIANICYGRTWTYI